MKLEQNGRTRLQMLRFVLRSAPGSYAEMAVYGVLNCLVTLCNVWSVQKLFGLLAAGMGEGFPGTLALYGTVLVLSAGYSVWYIRYRVQFCVIVDYEASIRGKLHAHSQSISNEVLETPDAYAKIRQADGARQNLFRYGEIWISIGMTVLQGLTLTGYLSAFAGWFFLLLPMAAVPAALEALYSAQLWKRDHAESAQCAREEDAYEQAMTDPAGCKESRLTGGAALLRRKWQSSRARRNALDEKRSKKAFLMRFALLPVQILGDTGGFLVSAVLLYCGEITFAGFTAGVAAYGMLTASVKALVGSFTEEPQWRNMIAPFFWYWDIPKHVGDQDMRSATEEIRLQHVSFRYSGQTTNAVSDVSMTIHAGEVIAIVGENGAGKTTLANLLLGLYLPTEGEVLYDGVSTARLRETELHRRQSAVMQNFARYQLTVGDNIRIADFRKTGAVEQQIAEIFPDGKVAADTRLGKAFGGRELSGGQWQQLSCARGFWKDSDLVVLDEATSAIDPLREKAMYNRFRQEMVGKTGVLITHRLGAVSMADRIIVLADGAIAQTGTHSELLAQDGIYARLWASQAGAYG